MRPCFFAVHDARQAGVAVPVDVVARVGPVDAAEPGGVQERVDDGSVVAGHNPAVRPPAQESRLVCTSAPLVASSPRTTAVRAGIGRFSPDPPGWAEPEANRAGRSRSTTRARRTCGAGASGVTGAAPPSTGRGDIRRVGGWPPLVTSRAEGAQLAAGPGCPRRPTGSLPGCRCARSPARRRW